MRRLFEPAAYGPQGACYWADTVPLDVWPALGRDSVTDVAVIGGGVTGLSAALRLAECGVGVTLLEAEHAGWGASGRNGGFCCLGGAKASDRTLRRRHGAAGLAAWQTTETAAIDWVDGFLSQSGAEVDRHSNGETVLAHSAKAWADMQSDARHMRARYGVEATLIQAQALREQGLGGSWHGAMTIPLGFALNPRKYHAALAKAARHAGAMLHAESPALSLNPAQNGWRVTTPNAVLTARRVVIATNGYSSEDLPRWLRARTLPTPSSVLVTRPLTQSERDAQGWHSSQMAFDSRVLLHYFRLMPDGRFLFGMRGGLSAAPRDTARTSERLRAHFAQLFPAWRDVEITHEWSGLVCLMARLTPFVGPVPGQQGLFAALGYHGNGVAMGSYAGRLVGDLARGTDPDLPYPDAMRAKPWRFPLGRHRRVLLKPLYWAADRFDL